jgi:hypothetical protein
MPQPELQPESFGAVEAVRSTQLDAGDTALRHCRVWLKWAAAHVEGSLTRDGVASGDLLRALAEVLGPERPISAAMAATTDAATTDAATADAAKEMSAVVIAVQSHDRVMQELAHVAESLRALDAQLGDARRANSTESWRALRETQFRAFSMAEERALFLRMVAHEDGIQPEAELTPDDTVELFTDHHRSSEP